MRSIRVQRAFPVSTCWKWIYEKLGSAAGVDLEMQSSSYWVLPKLLEKLVSFNLRINFKMCSQ